MILLNQKKKWRRYDLKGKCYYCNEKLSERTVKKHVKGCSIRKEKIKESIEIGRAHV